jgi:hypothetical protein
VGGARSLKILSGLGEATLAASDAADDP